MGSNSCSVNPHHIRQKLVSFIHAVSIYLILPLFSFLSIQIHRLLRGRVSLTKNENKEIEILETEQEIWSESSEFRGFDDVNEEEEGQHLKFKFPTFEEFSKAQKGTVNVFNSEVVPSSSTSKYQFTSVKSLLIHELETFPVSEINESRVVDFSEESSEEKEEPFLDQKSSHGEIGTVLDKGKKVVVFDDAEENAEPVQEFLDDSTFCNEDDSVVDNGSDSGSTSFDPGTNSLMDGFLSDGDFGVGLEIDDEDEEMETESTESELISELDENRDGFDEDSDIMEELSKIEEEESKKNENPPNLDGVKSKFLSEKDFNDEKQEEFGAKDDKETMDGGDGPDKPKSKDSSMSDSNKLESLWEHQELIEQLKMELKKVRATGLPTIMEESESPKIMDDLKPWKIDERFHHEDCIGELHKFYKSYREKMRKFDILNYQKMYAMGFLQLKDPLQSMSDHKPSAPTLKSLVSETLWLSKHKVHGSDPMKKFIKELQGDLEVVYVGQMCLSWEFLHWQYEKALDLWESDPRGIHRYNEVAGEFQQFQVLMQRFIEDEPFQGPRVQNYVKSRCVLRNLLQVPVIREDNLRDKKKARNKDGDEYVITSDMLVEIMEESIRIFWRFVRADKDATISTINGHKKTQPELQNPEDLKLLVDIRKILQKKERKVKDLLRSENCILKKFRQCSEDDDSDQVLYFFSQVDMKLVARVLNMSKITRDQLMWCHNKLSRISFVNKKIYVEPAFLLFPC